MSGDLIQGLVTGIIALAGIVLTQFRADRREDKRWERDRRHEAEVWKRTETERTYDHRRDAYVALLDECERVTNVIDRAQMGGSGAPVPEDFLAELLQRCLIVDVYGTRAGAAAARVLYEVVVEIAYRPDPDWDAFRSDRAAYIDQVRRDLKVPDA